MGIDKAQKIRGEEIGILLKERSLICSDGNPLARREAKVITTPCTNFEIGFEILVEYDLVALETFDPEISGNIQTLVPVPLGRDRFTLLAKPFGNGTDKPILPMCQPTWICRDFVVPAGSVRYYNTLCQT